MKYFIFSIVMVIFIGCSANSPVVETPAKYNFMLIVGWDTANPDTMYAYNVIRPFTSKVNNTSAWVYEKSRDDRARVEFTTDKNVKLISGRYVDVIE